MLLGDLLRYTVTFSSALLLRVVLAQVERCNRVIGLPGRIAQRVFRAFSFCSESLHACLCVPFEACRDYLVLFLLKYVPQVLT